MFRITKKVFSDLGIFMIAFGILIGLLFPVFVFLLGVPKHTAFRFSFWFACMSAGILAGGFNFWIARSVVASRIQLMNDKMKKIEHTLQTCSFANHQFECIDDKCFLPVDSQDFIGENARTFNALLHALQQSFLLHRDHRMLTEILNSYLELGELAQKTLEEILRFTTATAGLLAYDASGELAIAANIGILKTETVLKNPIIKKVFHSGHWMMLDLPTELQVDGVLLAFSPRYIITIPIPYKNVSIGVLLLAFTTVPNKDFAMTMRPFVQGIGLALNNAIMYERLQQIAAMDPLTGVYNRRFGQARLHEEFGRAVRAQSPLGLLMFDIDYFKKFNDTYGHLTGDRVLKSVAATCRRCLREGDVLVRFGGEEFLAALPAASCEDIKHIGERIRKAVEDLKIPEDDHFLSVTISVGGAAFPCEGIHSDTDLIQKADEALYRAKKAGRNRVEI